MRGALQLDRHNVLGVAHGQRLGAGDARVRRPRGDGDRDHRVLDRRPERQTAERCRKNQVSLLAYGTLAGGFLSDRWLSRHEPTPAEVEASNRSLVKYKLIIDDGGGWESFQNLLGVLDSIAERRETTISAVALAWVLRETPVAGLVVGVGHARRLSETRRALDLKLSPLDRREISEALALRLDLPGDVYALERRPEGRHAGIMRYDLQTAGA